MALSNFLFINFIAIVVTCYLCHGSILGGKKRVDAKDEDVKKAAAFAELAVNQPSNAYYYMKMTKIVDAESQLVAGHNYFLTLEMTSTVCTKTKYSEDPASCNLNPGEKNAHATQLCDVTVYVDLKNTSSLTNYHCQPAKQDKNKLKM